MANKIEYLDFSSLKEYHKLLEKLIDEKIQAALKELNNNESIDSAGFYDIYGNLAVKWEDSGVSLRDFDEIDIGNFDLDTLPEDHILSFLCNNTDLLIRKIVLPNNVTKIGKLACFSSMIQEIVIPEGVEIIEDYAFENCSATNIIIPNSVTSIGSYAFSGSQYLSEVTIGESVSFMGEGVFALNESLTKIIFKDTTSSWELFDTITEEKIIIDSSKLINPENTVQYFNSKIDDDDEEYYFYTWTKL